METITMKLVTGEGIFEGDSSPSLPGHHDISNSALAFAPTMMVCLTVIQEQWNHMTQTKTMNQKKSSILQISFRKYLVTVVKN